MGIALSLCRGELYPDLNLTSSASTLPCDGDTTTTATPDSQTAASASATAPAASESAGLAGGDFPGNCFFKCEDFVNSAHGNVKKYDVIMCMSVTKWVHLNWGDEGVTSLFRKCFDMLVPGGRFILEPQRWRSYKKKRNISEATRHHFGTIKLR